MRSDLPDEFAMRVVVLAGDPEDRHRISSALRLAGLTSSGHGTGADGLREVAETEVSLVVIHERLKGMSAHECARLIKVSVGDFVPVLMLLDDANPEKRVASLDAGADALLPSNAIDSELVAQARALLRIRDRYDGVRSAKDRLAKLAVRDELTNLYNYRYLRTRFSEEFKRAERYKDPLSCVMMDIDEFKLFNDSYGHEAGNLVLIEVARRLGGAIREMDLLARYGGEEFLMLLPSTHFAGALAAATRVWRAVGGTPMLIAGGRHRVTISVGVATYPSRDILNGDALLKAADEALYQAKANGRNRICVYQHAGVGLQPELSYEC